jgi:hypothetical protein
MKSSILATLVALAIGTSAVSHAQTNQPVTRAQVRAEVVALERYGYKPNRDDYPVTLLRAQQRLSEEQDAKRVDEPASTGTSQ